VWVGLFEIRSENPRIKGKKTENERHDTKKKVKEGITERRGGKKEKKTGKMRRPDHDGANNLFRSKGEEGLSRKLKKRSVYIVRVKRTSRLSGGQGRGHSAAQLKSFLT